MKHLNMTLKPFDAMWQHACPVMTAGTMTALYNHIYDECMAVTGKGLIQTQLLYEDAEWCITHETD